MAEGRALRGGISFLRYVPAITQRGWNIGVGIRHAELGKKTQPARIPAASERNVELVRVLARRACASHAMGSTACAQLSSHPDCGVSAGLKLCGDSHSRGLCHHRPVRDNGVTTETRCETQVCLCALHSEQPERCEVTAGL